MLAIALNASKTLKTIRIAMPSSNAGSVPLRRILGDSTPRKTRAHVERRPNLRLNDASSFRPARGSCHAASPAISARPWSPIASSPIALNHFVLRQWHEKLPHAHLTFIQIQIFAIKTYSIEATIRFTIATAER